MKTYREVKVQLHTSLTSTLDGGEWSASRAGFFTLREVSHLIGWVGPRASLDTVVEGKKFLPLPGTEPRSSNP
jgi:hypothetical protein